MTNKPTLNNDIDAQLQELPFHGNATDMLQNHMQKVNATLSIQAELIARRQNADIVLSCHVNKAIQDTKKSETKSFHQELVIILGAALLGAFTGEFLPQLLLGNTLLIGIYVIFGFVGLVTIIWALQSQDTNLHI